MNSETYQERMRRKLTEKLTPILLEITDDSKRHAGHSGHNPLGETHFIVKIVSPAFNGLSRIRRHRLVYDAIADELQERVHALNISALSPDEHNL